VSLTTPKSLAAILGGAVVIVVLAQIVPSVLLVLVAIAGAVAAVVVERSRGAARVQEVEASVAALVAERSALSDITTGIAHQQPPEKTFELVANYAAKLVGGTAAQVEPLARADVRTAHGRVRAIVMAGNEKWGTLVLDGVSATDLPAARLQLLQNLADLAGLAVSTANTRTQLLMEAQRDPLTGLANQRAFHRELAEEMSRARRHGRPLALILLDLDNFKAINAAEGPPGGDRVLIEVAKRVRGALRLEAHVARLGGDELAVLLPECDANGAYAVAERVRNAVRAEETEAGNRVTASAGVAALEPSGEGGISATGTTEELLQAADSALWSAKRIGGDTTVRFTPKLSETAPVSPETLRSPRAAVARSV
jgi:diguanylate cyclase (GGDEF)-like protein